jgi:HD-like signal output (HDOD) protein
MKPVTALDRNDSVLTDIRTFLRAAGELPSPKGVAAQLVTLTQDPEASLAEVARLVRSDPALTAFLVRAANAARYTGSPKVVDPGRAVARLGMNMVRVYAIAASVLGEHRRGDCLAFDYGLYWGRCLLGAILMESLASRCDGFPAEEAFALGLLGRVGRLAFATAAPGDYAEIIERALAEGRELEVLEQQRFGFDQNELTAVLLVDWGIPTRLADVVYWQRDPEAGGFSPDSIGHRLAGALRLATELADASLPGLGADETGSVYLRAGMLGMTEQELRSLVGSALASWAEWAQLLELKVQRTRTPIPQEPARRPLTSFAARI